MIAVHSRFLKTSGQFFGDRSRAGFLYCAWFVFVLIIVESFFRHDLNYWIGYSVNDRNCVFHTLDEFFDDNFVFVFKSFIQCFDIIFLVIYDIDTDAGTTAACLDNYRKFHAKCRKRVLTVFFLHGFSARCAYASHLKHCFGHAFVHCHRTA